MKSSEKFNQAIADFDRLNAQDPNVRRIGGESVPFELFFANRMTDWVSRLDPHASESVRLAARCQHLCRWEIPRASYPEGRTGYLTWRRDLKQFHADRSEEVLRGAKYDDVTIDRVRTINLKKGLGKDPEVQIIEDALCLVFLENQFEALIAKTDTGKMVAILQKTWGKMSPRAQELAMSLSYSEKEKEVIRKALDS